MRFLVATDGRLALKAGLLFFAISLSACASYQSKVSVARDLMSTGHAAEAADKLKPLADKDDGDRLVYMLDYATALQAAGQYKDSTKAFLAADKLSEQLDYHSISRVTGSLLLNEEVKQYKGDTFEKVFINAQLAMNYLELGELDDALVESRRINEKYLKLRADDKKELALNPFAKYLSAIVWEADRKYDDAFIAYQEAYDIDPTIEGIQADLIRSSKLARREDMYKRWKKAFPDVVENPDWYDKNQSELIILVQQGWGPRKTYSPQDARWPMLVSSHSTTRRARVTVDGDLTKDSREIYDVAKAAIKTLEEDRLSLLGRRMAGIVAKEVAADQIRQKNELLGFVAWVALHASDRADLRQWSTLPESVQIIRLPLKPGSHRVSLQGLDGGGSPTADHLEERTVDLKSGRKTFLVWRTLR